MPTPLEILCVSAQPIDLGGSPYGPFVQHPCRSLQEAQVELQQGRNDALLIEADGPAALALVVAWPALAAAVLETAVVVVSPEPAPDLVLRLLQHGVQDVIEPAQTHALARVLRLSIERKRAECRARKASATDLATGLPNLDQLLEHMSHLVALREREPAPMALIVLCIEGLVATEDLLGVEAANVLKRKVAVRLRAALRASDVVAALGGGSLAVLLAWIEAAGDGERVMHKLAQRLTRPFSVSGRQRRIGVRAGLALFPQHAHQAQLLLRHAWAQAARATLLGGADPGPGADRGPQAAANDDE